MTHNSSIDQETFDYSSEDESFCSEDFHGDRLETISPITLCKDDRSHMEYTSQLSDQLPSSIIQIYSLESLDNEKCMLAHLQKDHKPNHKIKSGCSLHSNEEENQKTGELITQIDQVKHQLLLAHIELKQHNVYNDKLKDGIEQLQNLILKAKQRPEDSEFDEELNSFLSTKEKEDSNSSDDENEQVSESPIQESRNRIHSLNKSVRDLKNKDMLWRNFSCNIKQLMEEIEESHTNFPILPRVKSMLDLLQVKASHKEKKGDSFINHMINSPALIQYHFDKLLEEVNEKEEEIKKIKDECAIIQSEKQSLINSNKLLKLKLKEQEQRKPARIVRRRTNTRDNDSPFLGHQGCIGSIETFFTEKESKTLNLCRNLFKSCRISRKKLDFNLEFLRSIQHTKQVVRDLNRDEALEEIQKMMEIHTQNEDMYWDDNEKDLENGNQIVSSLKRYDRISYLSSLDTSSLDTNTSNEVCITPVSYEQRYNGSLLDRIDSLDSIVSRISKKVGQKH